MKWELPETHRQVLEALARRPPDLENIDPDVLEELRRWGMVTPKSLEFTGMRMAQRLNCRPFVLTWGRPDWRWCLNGIDEHRLPGA